MPEPLGIIKLKTPFYSTYVHKHGPNVINLNTSQIETQRNKGTRAGVFSCQRSGGELNSIIQVRVQKQFQLKTAPNVYWGNI